MTDDIVTRLRRWVVAVDAVPASDLMDAAADEIERLRLTDEERRAIEVARRCLLPCHDDFDATLGRLLERLA